MRFRLEQFIDWAGVNTMQPLLIIPSCGRTFDAQVVRGEKRVIKFTTSFILAAYKVWRSCIMM